MVFFSEYLYSTCASAPHSTVLCTVLLSRGACLLGHSPHVCLARTGLLSEILSAVDNMKCACVHTLSSHLSQSKANATVNRVRHQLEKQYVGDRLFTRDSVFRSHKHFLLVAIHPTLYLKTC